ncbi:DUF1015 domain-containing protein [Microbacteriaceae bacterium 4G12]
MATIRPFPAIRPVPELASKVAALPYDVLNSNEARELVKDNPYSFLHIDKAEIDLDPAFSAYDNRVYKKAQENLLNMMRNHVLVQDEKQCLYIYKLIMDGRSQVGLVGCTSIDEYMNDTIKKHEHTREEKEVDRIRHVDACDANTGPIFLTYRAKQTIQVTISQWMDTHVPVYDFVADDNVTHTIWIVDEINTIEQLVQEFQTVENLYIADGHHRSASAVKVGLQRREQYPNYTGEEEFNYFLSVLFPDEQLEIFDYNRIVKDLNGLDVSKFLEKIKTQFSVEKAETVPYKPTAKHTFGMYVGQTWYKLTVNDTSFDTSNPVERLDVSILQTRLLEPILHIQNPRADSRIDFVGGIRGLHELEKAVDEKGWAVAFSMYPTTMDDLFAIADAKEVMPPKSTWFEPKLRSGLFIHSLS